MKRHPLICAALLAATAFALLGWALQCKEYLDDEA